jgi:hypothetical protein
VGVARHQRGADACAVARAWLVADAAVAAPIAARRRLARTTLALALAVGSTCRSLVAALAIGCGANDHGSTNYNYLVIVNKIVVYNFVLVVVVVRLGFDLVQCRTTATSSPAATATTRRRCTAI